jgi:hypothetical protein
MRALPNIETAAWTPVIGYVPNTNSLWRATVEYRPCVYRGVQSIGGRWLDTPQRTTIYATGYEIDAMLEHGELRILRATGYVMDGERGGSLSDYVDTFYRLKQTTTDDTTRITAKLFLNSLYGKFFQKVPLGIVGAYEWESGDYIAGTPDQEGDFVAGGLYHPPIASLITGFVRAKIHRLEHRYAAIMTSTDGIFATTPPDAADIGTSLGMLDVTRGRLRIWRERLYLFDYADADGKPKRKDARHGFRGSTGDLERIPLEHGRYAYRAQAVITLGMSTRAWDGKRREPGEFVTLPFGLDV